MAERFGPGYDRNDDGRPDLPNSLEYVNPGRYEVELVAHADTVGSAVDAGACDWTVVGRAEVITLRAAGPRSTVRLPEGTYTVTVTVKLADGRIGSARETIRVKDILIVALGDSLATGEGNPERPARWGGSGTSRKGSAILGRLDPMEPAHWASGGPGGDRPRMTCKGILPPVDLLHARAHRSTYSGPAQFAMRMEAADPHTSVTFVCLAATGTHIDDLFRTDRSNRNHALGPGPPLPAQLDELHAIIGSRPVDFLILAVGFNDAGSIELLGELIRREIGYVAPIRLLAAYPARRDWAAAAMRSADELMDAGELRRLKELEPGAQREAVARDIALIYDLAESAANGLAVARGQVDRLSRAVAQDPLLARVEVGLLEYPDLTRDGNGVTAAAILDDLVPGLRVNRRELDLARERLLRPLNSMLREAADRHGWTFVRGIFDAFRDHGYAAKETWFVRAKESEDLQGPRLSPLGYLRGEITPGMLHPNHRGHQVIADRLIRSLGRRRFSAFPTCESDCRSNRFERRQKNGEPSQ
jgi:lysophospholipase L1-like esterase